MSIHSSISSLYANSNSQLTLSIGLLGHVLEDNIRYRRQLIILEGGVSTVDADLAFIFGVFTIFLEMEISSWGDGTTVVVFEDIVPIGCAVYHNAFFVHTPFALAHIVSGKTLVAVGNGIISM